MNSRLDSSRSYTRSPARGRFFARLIALAYLPAAVVPVGLTNAGLPVGMQIIAPHLEDRTATDVARQIERTIGGYQPPPLG